MRCGPSSVRRSMVRSGGGSSGSGGSGDSVLLPRSPRPGTRSRRGDVRPAPTLRVTAPTGRWPRRTPRRSIRSASIRSATSAHVSATCWRRSPTSFACALSNDRAVRDRGLGRQSRGLAVFVGLRAIRNSICAIASVSTARACRSAAENSSRSSSSASTCFRLRRPNIRSLLGIAGATLCPYPARRRCSTPTDDAAKTAQDGAKLS